MIIKNLFIVRHGHSSFDAPMDFQRNLTEEGQVAASKAAEFIQAQANKFGLKVGICVSSSAHRTQQTGDIICQKLGLSAHMTDKALYSAVTGTWMDKIEEVKDKVMILVGHNPTMSQVLSLFSGQQFYMSPAQCGHVEIEVHKDGIQSPGRLLEFFNNEQ